MGCDGRHAADVAEARAASESVRSAYLSALYGKPSVDTGACAICGRLGGDLHHVVQKGMGGVSAAQERLIPKIRLCGMGNSAGHHGMLHARLLHVYWSDAMGGWVYFISRVPMCDDEALARFSGQYMPVRGWAEQQRARAVYGRR